MHDESGWDFFAVHDNEDLVKRASSLLTRMCAFAPPQGLLEQVLDRIFDAIQHSTVSLGW
jgi:hypothetical protein